MTILFVVNVKKRDNHNELINIESLYQGNIGEKRYVVSSSTDVSGENYKGRVINSFYRIRR